MIAPADWPALKLARLSAAPAVEYERGVWGKVHGAASDFRWIARSPAFGLERSDLPRQLDLGSEDRPVHFQAWRNLGDRCYAVSAYPSRAMDAAGRSGFLEKQMLEWRMTPAIPAALAALLLLPLAARMTDHIWWDRAGDAPWSDRGAFLPIAAKEQRPFVVDEEQVSAAIERGRGALRELVALENLEMLYDQLLRGSRPAYLCGVRQPLPAEALAALLLPLPAELSERLSVAGWIPSTNSSLPDLGTRWDIVAGARQATAAASSSPRARELAEALLTGETPSGLASLNPTAIAPPPAPKQQMTTRPATPRKSARFRPGSRLDLTPPAVGSPKIVQELYAFAAAADRRWLSPDTLKEAGGKKRFAPDEPSARLLCAWVTEVRSQRPTRAHEAQWSAKVDVLRGAALVLVPAASTVATVGLPDAGSVVPALLFGCLLDGSGERDALAALGGQALRTLIEQSTARGSSAFWSRRVSDWLRNWESHTNSQTVRNAMVGLLSRQRP
jgi:hypothetical protein